MVQLVSTSFLHVSSIRHEDVTEIESDPILHAGSHNLAHARVVIAAWAADYNTERPHSALDYQTPADYARALTTAIARPAARDESSARRAIAQPAPIGVNTNRAPVAAG